MLLLLTLLLTLTVCDLGTASERRDDLPVAQNKDDQWNDETPGEQRHSYCTCGRHGRVHL